MAPVEKLLFLLVTYLTACCFFCVSASWKYSADMIRRISKHHENSCFYLAKNILKRIIHDASRWKTLCSFMIQQSCSINGILGKIVSIGLIWLRRDVLFELLNLRSVDVQDYCKFANVYPRVLPALESELCISVDCSFVWMNSVIKKTKELLKALQAQSSSKYY